MVPLFPTIPRPERRIILPNFLWQPTIMANDENNRERTEAYFRRVGICGALPESAEKDSSFLVLLFRHLRVDHVDRGRVICVLTVHPEIVNIYNTLHGGAVSSVAEEVAMACVKTVAGDKEFFLGEAESSYLSSAKIDAQVEIDAQILRLGRRVVVASVKFFLKETRKLLFTYRATFYSMPAASL